jgi:hypothetical protein
METSTNLTSDSDPVPAFPPSPLVCLAKAPIREVVRRGAIEMPSERHSASEVTQNAVCPGSR